jgi:soluble lytic murein transglycosylase-like protein
MADKHGLPYELVCAVIEQESNWDEWAIRYEPQFQLHYVAPLHLEITEEIARSFSWGLMQVMGQVAREHGFTGHLSSLCEPLNGLEMGCLHLKGKIDRAGTIREGLQAWNGGANLQYADQVLARTQKYSS